MDPPTSLSRPERDYLFALLEAQGWYWQGDTIFAPHRSIWFQRANPWCGALSEFHERMAARLSRIETAPCYADDPQLHREVINDTKGLVDALALVMDGAKV
jgi:hypothetical protein